MTDSKMQATLNLPEAETRTLVREELAKIARDESRWLSRERAAEHVDLELSAFNRLAKLYALPKSKLNAKVVRYYTPDVDAMMLAHLRRPQGAAIIDFPSASAHEALLKKAPKSLRSASAPRAKSSRAASDDDGDLTTSLFYEHRPYHFAADRFERDRSETRRAR